MLQSKIARIGLAVAIRRFDLSLLKTCFDILWGKDPISLDRNWLRWRLPIIIMHEACYLMGEYVEFQNRITKQKIVVNSKQEERAYRAFLYKLSAAFKCKDALALYGLIQKLEVEPEERYIIDMELTKSYWWLRELDRVGSNELVCSKLFRYLVHEEYPPGFFNVAKEKYCFDAVYYLMNFATSIGTDRDRRVAICNAILYGRRPMIKESIKKLWDNRIDLLLKDPKIKKPSTVQLPWYAYLDSEIGEKVIRKFKDKGDLVKLLWLMVEICRVPKSAMIIKPVDHATRSDNVESVWWIPFVKSTLRINDDITPKAMMQSWNEYYALECEDLVNNEVKKLSK